MSIFQKKVLAILKAILKETPITTEVNVRKLFPGYPDHNHHYDIVIPSYKIIFECHGEQHRSIQSFGEKDLTKVASGLVGQKYRDRKKEEAAWENGWGYAVIWHDELPKDDDEAVKLVKKLMIEAISRSE